MPLIQDLSNLTQNYPPGFIQKYSFIYRQRFIHLGSRQEINAQDCAVFWLTRFYKIRQGTSTSPYEWICAGGCNAVDGRKDKTRLCTIFLPRPLRYRVYFNPTFFRACLQRLDNCLFFFSRQLSKRPSPGATAAQYFSKSSSHSLAT